VESFDLSVGLWPVEAGLLHGDGEFVAGVTPQVGPVGTAVEFLRDVKRLRVA
jgi:hypothetical protein